MDIGFVYTGEKRFEKIGRENHNYYITLYQSLHHLVSTTNVKKIEKMMSLNYQHLIKYGTFIRHFTSCKRTYSG